MKPINSIKLFTFLQLLKFSSCATTPHRITSYGFRPMEAKEATLPILERYYLLVKYHEPVCGFEDGEVSKPTCWSDRANAKIKFNHTRLLVEELQFCNGTALPLPESIYKSIDEQNSEVLNSPVSHLNAIALIDGVASIQLIKSIDNNKGLGSKMKYDAQIILDDLLYRTASDETVDFFAKYKGYNTKYFLHRPKLNDLINRLNVYLTTNYNDRNSFMELPTRLKSEMISQARTLRNAALGSNHDLTLINIVKSFGLGEIDFGSLTRPVFLERCTHEPDRQLISMDFIYQTTQKFTYLLPYDPKKFRNEHSDIYARSERAGEINPESEEYQESFLDLAKRRVMDTIGGIRD